MNYKKEEIKNACELANKLIDQEIDFALYENKEIVEACKQTCKFTIDHIYTILDFGERYHIEDNLKEAK